MDINPYQSPQTPTPLAEHPSAESDSIRQLLIDIRDTQRETLELMRQADLRGKKVTSRNLPFLIVFIAIMGAMMAFNFYRMTQLRRPVTPVPARSPVRPVSGLWQGALDLPGAPPTLAWAGAQRRARPRERERGTQSMREASDARRVPGVAGHCPAAVL